MEAGSPHPNRTHSHTMSLIEALPGHLRPRVAGLGSGSVRPDGEFVLCWLHHAVRGHENPVLDVAVHLGNTLSKPVLVYQGLGGNHRFNSDRQHTFILEGARDLQAELATRRIACAFHLPQNPVAPGPICDLAHRSCLVVTEDFPAPPFPRWTARLTERTGRATLVVDGACLLPVRAGGKRHTRAFKFRDAAKKLWRAVIEDRWLDAEPESKQIDIERMNLGFEPADLSTLNIAAACASCDIDHGVPPVGRVQGGSVAGYERWEAFRRRHLGRYDRRRNDAADMEAVSGLSPYLHHGHVSPFRIAREAHAAGGKGAEKFLDELLVWRELAFHFCAHTPEDELESLEAIPDWARATLAEHTADPREALFSWETLARAKTESPLWNLAQRSLIRNGELHNNLRMTWGKAIASWTRSPEDALRKLIDLNHRYALDGCDPNSYGGLLWCLGQFDRPFSPEEPVLGSVRARSVIDHADRLSPDLYASAVEARCGHESLRVVVVGAGIAGLTCARALQEHGCDVTVYDRGRGPGGRMSTRVSREHDGLTFDHGCPYFTVTDARFGRFVRSWIEDGVAARWQVKAARWDGTTFETMEPNGPHVVGTPSMAAICEHLSRGIDVRCSSTVSRVQFGDGAWTVWVGDSQVTQGVDALVLAMAPEQANRLVGPGSTSVIQHLDSARSEPVWVGLYRVRGVSETAPDLLMIDGDPVIERIVRTDRKPGRAASDHAVLTVYARSKWSSERYDHDREPIAEELEHQARLVLRAVTGSTIDAADVTHRRAHRWGLARPVEPAAKSCLWDDDDRVVVCGDGFGGSGVEAAFLSGRAAAGRVLAWRPRAQRRPIEDSGSLFAGGGA